MVPSEAPRSTEDNNDDNWAKAVGMLTGWEMPPRDTLFDTVKGNDEIPLMHVRLLKEGGPDYDALFNRPVAGSRGWRSFNTDYTIPFYAPDEELQGGGVVPAGKSLYRWRAYITFLGHVVGTPTRGWGAVVGDAGTNPALTTTGLDNTGDTDLTWDTTPLAKYIQGSVDAVNYLLHHNTTHGFRYAGVGVPDAAYVDLHSFTEVAEVFETAVTFFEKSAATIDGWDTENIGEGSDSWDGTGAAIFKDLIHKLARNYEGYADQVGGAGRIPFFIGSKSDPARALEELRLTLRTQAKNLSAAWSSWMSLPGPFGGNPHGVLYGVLEEVQYALAGQDYDFDSKTTVTGDKSSGFSSITDMSVITGPNFKNGITTDGIFGEVATYGPPTASATWKAIGQKAVDRWKQYAQENIAVAGAEARLAIQEAFTEAAKAFDTKIVDKDTRSLSEISTKEQADAEKKKLEAANAATAAENKRLADEAEKNRLEALRLAAEDRAKADADRLKNERQAAEDRAQQQADRLENKRLAAEAREQQEKDRLENKRLADEEKAEAKAAAAAAKAEADQEKAEAKAAAAAAKAEADQEKAEVKAQNAQDRAEAKQTQEEARQRTAEQQASALALAARQRAEAKQEKDEEKAEAKAAQAAAKVEADQEKAEAKAEQAAAKAEADQEKAEVKAQNAEDRAKAEQAQEKAEQQAAVDRAAALKEQAAAKTEADQEKAEVKAQNAQDRAKAEQAQEEAKQQAAVDRAAALQDQAEAKSEATAGRDAAEKESARQEAAASQQYEQARAEAEAEAEQDRTEARQDYDRQIAAGVDEDVAREDYDRRIGEIDASEREALQQARQAAAGAGSSGTGNGDLSELIRQRIADLPQPPDLSSYYPSGDSGSANSSVFADNLYGQDDPTSALGRPGENETASSGASTGSGGTPMMPPMSPRGGGDSGGTNERARNVYEPTGGRSGRAANAARATEEQEHRVVRGTTPTSSNSPFMPPMTGGQGAGGNGQRTESNDRERTTWLAEDEDVWGTDEGGAPQALGR
ncbi:AAWKG family protein [Streptomyces sp. NPDC102441]|uniref:AAWKG family protein n=1 Tax=Streptomyces sp. NPDC102441 TaxID=3366176 RepID=UPI00381B4B72